MHAVTHIAKSPMPSYTICAQCGHEFGHMNYSVLFHWSVMSLGTIIDSCSVIVISMNMVDRLTNYHFCNFEAKIVGMIMKDLCNGKWLIDWKMKILGVIFHYPYFLQLKNKQNFTLNTSNAKPQNKKIPKHQIKHSKILFGISKHKNTLHWPLSVSSMMMGPLEVRITLTSFWHTNCSSV